jgi:hypothetical protein
MNYVDSLLQRNQINDECKMHIYPMRATEMSFTPLNLYTLSGSFVLILCLFSFSFGVLLIEICMHRCLCKKDTLQIMTIADELDLLLSNGFLDKVLDENLNNVLPQYYVFRNFLVAHEKH